MSRLRSFGIGLLWSVWFSICFTTFLWLSFPWSRVRDHLIVRAADGGLSVQMVSLGAAWFGVRARELAVGPYGGGEESAPWIVFESLRVSSGPAGLLRAAMESRKLGGKLPADRPSVLKLLGGLDVSGDLYGGELDIEVDPADQGAHFTLSGEDLDVSQRVWKGDSWSATPTGRMDLSGDLSWSTKEAKDTEGTIDLSLGDLVLSGVKVMGIDAPAAKFSKAEAHLKISKGRGEFRDTIFESDVVTAAVEGTVSLGTEWKRCRLALKLKFDLKEGMELVEGLLKASGGGSHQDNEGYWHYQVIGTLDNPRFRASASNARRAGNAAKDSRRSAPRSATIDSGSDSPPAPSNLRESPGSGDPTDPDYAVEDRAADRAADRDRLKEQRQQRREERRKKREELVRLREDREADRAAGGLGATGGIIDDGPQLPPEEDIERTNEPETFDEPPLEDLEEE